MYELSRPFYSFFELSTFRSKNIVLHDFEFISMRLRIRNQLKSHVHEKRLLYFIENLLELILKFGSQRYIKLFELYKHRVQLD